MSIDALADMSAPNRWRDTPAPPPPPPPPPPPGAPPASTSGSPKLREARVSARAAPPRGTSLGHYQIFTQVQVLAAIGKARGRKGDDSRRGCTENSTGPFDPMWRKISVEVLQRTFDRLLELLACPEAGYQLSARRRSPSCGR